jgi:hypothetical protein
LKITYFNYVNIIPIYSYYQLLLYDFFIKLAGMKNSRDHLKKNLFSYSSMGQRPIARFVETLHILLKKEEYVDRSGFHPLPVPPPIRYSSAGLNLGHSRKLQRFGDYSLSQLGSP